MAITSVAEAVSSGKHRVVRTPKASVPSTQIISATAAPNQDIIFVTVQKILPNNLTLPGKTSTDLTIDPRFRTILRQWASQTISFNEEAEDIAVVDPETEADLAMLLSIEATFQALVNSPDQMNTQVAPR